MNFHKVVDCQWACPAHTPVPESIGLIAQARYDDAYRVNWVSNVFPGVLGRTCDRPCEPACRCGRAEEEDTAAPAKPEPAAICRLKRVAAGFKSGEVRAMIPKAQPKNGKEVVCVGAGPASLTVARDLASQGYAVTVYDGETKAGGFIRSQIPRFRLPGRVAAADHIHIGIDWLASVSFGHVTAMDCCRSARWHPVQQRPCAASLCD